MMVVVVKVMMNDCDMMWMMAMTVMMTVAMVMI
jgi:hypothetical protein